MSVMTEQEAQDIVAELATVRGWNVTLVHGDTPEISHLVTRALGETPHSLAIFSSLQGDLNLMGWEIYDPYTEHDYVGGPMRRLW